MKFKFLFAVLLSLAWSAPVLAGKVEDIQAAVKKSCGKDLGSAEALKLVKDLFLQCTPGQKADVEGCAVDCLKANSGAVVGG